MVDIWHAAKPNIDNGQESSIQNELDVSSSEYSEDDDSGSYYDSDTEDSYSDEDENTDSTEVKVTDTTVTRGMEVAIDKIKIKKNRRRCI